VLAVAVLAIVLIPGGTGRDEQSEGGAGSNGSGKAEARGAARELAKLRGVEVRLKAEAEVWVCLVDGKGDPLVEGQILDAGAEEGPFRSGSFTLSLGNGEVTMLIDGKQAEIPATSSPIGYSIDSTGSISELNETDRPTCT
jgi:hypothetical protein